jgi:hypothetical protein
MKASGCFIRRSAYPTKMPAKSRTSVERKSHMPNFAASNSSSAFRQWCWWT